MMDLSSRTSEKKIYIRNKYSDGLPLTSSDMHNEKDLLIKKMGILLDNMVGSSPLEDPQLGSNEHNNSIDIKFNKSLPINLDGEIFLVNNSENIYPWTDISEECSLVLVAWYENITANSTIYEYGGIKNSTMENDLLDPTLRMQTSSRYQIRWHVATTSKIFNADNLDTSEFTLSEVSSVKGTIQSYVCKPANNKVNGKFIVNDISLGVSPADAGKITPYADGKIYILPIARIDLVLGELIVSSYKAASPVYNIVTPETPKAASGQMWYNPSSDTFKFYVNGEWKYIGGNQIISQSTEPTGIYKEGTIWYNTTTGEFKFYINNLGFVDIYSKMGFVQLQATTVITEQKIAEDITLPIPIDTYLESDILRVVYEGAELALNVHYTINSTAKTITLLNFTTDYGDTVLFIVTRSVGTSDMRTTLTLLDEHIRNIGNSTSSGHLKLSDTPSSTNDSSKGIAATPAALKSVENKINLITDDTTGKVYRLGVNNGLIYIKEEV